MVHDGQQSTGALVCPPGCADLAAMAFATGSSERLHMEALGGVPEATPVAATQDRPSLRLRERSPLLKTRMREICASGAPQRALAHAGRPPQPLLAAGRPLHGREPD